MEYCFLVNVAINGQTELAHLHTRVASVNSEEEARRAIVADHMSRGNTVKHIERIYSNIQSTDDNSCINF